MKKKINYSVVHGFEQNPVTGGQKEPAHRKIFAKKKDQIVQSRTIYLLCCFGNVCKKVLTNLHCALKELCQIDMAKGLRDRSNLDWHWEHKKKINKTKGREWGVRSTFFYCQFKKNNLILNIIIIRSDGRGVCLKGNFITSSIIQVLDVNSFITKTLGRFYCNIASKNTM